MELADVVITHPLHPFQLSQEATKDGIILLTIIIQAYRHGLVDTDQQHKS